MSILAKVGSWLAGGMIESAGKVATDVGRTFWGDKTEKEQHVSAEQLAIINQYAAEYVARQHRTWWDSFVDGLNRLVRPGLALGSQLAFVWVWWDPVSFAECMQALQLVPEMLWYIWLTIFGFFFGGRIIEKAPKTWKVEPRAMEVAREIAANRTERQKAVTAEKEAAAARKTALAKSVAARADERSANAEVRKSEISPEPDVQTPDDSVEKMAISERGLDLIRKFEGFEERAYVCPGGAMTIGYGHVIKPGEPYSQQGYTISGRSAMEVLDADCDIAENAINQLVKVPLTQNQFDALVSLVYNIGVGAFSKSTMLAKINARDYQSAADEFHRWNKSKGKVMAGLRNRREQESRLFLEE